MQLLRRDSVSSRPVVTGTRCIVPPRPVPRLSIPLLSTVIRMNDKPNKQHEQRLIVVLVLLLLALCAANLWFVVALPAGLHLASVPEAGGGEGQVAAGHLYFLAAGGVMVGGFQCPYTCS